MTRFQPGDFALFMVAMDPRMVILQGRPVRVMRAGIRAGDSLGLDADGTEVFAGAPVDYMIEFPGGFWRGLCHDWQLAPVTGPPDPPARVTRTETP